MVYVVLHKRFDPLYSVDLMNSVERGHSGRKIEYSANFNYSERSRSTILENIGLKMTRGSPEARESTVKLYNRNIIQF